MPKTTTFLALFACAALLLACHKEEKLPTIIKGKVTNSVTGEPVVGASIQSTISNKYKGVINKDNSTNSDFEGNYTVTIPPDFTGAIISVYKERFLPNVFPGMNQTFNLNIENILDIKLIPEDGFIRLKINNDVAEHDTLFVKFLSPTRQAQPHIGGLFATNNYPIVTAQGGIVSETKAVPSDEYIKIYWDFKDFNSILVAPFSDSVYVSRYDTVDYVIHF